LCPHIEWAVGGVLGVAVNMSWTPQPAQSGSYRAEHSWAGDAGSAAAVASALRGWNHLRFEITEEPTTTTEGSRYSYTPELGVFHAVSLEWTPQPAQAGTYRAEFSWLGEPGTAASVVSALRGWNHLRFEVTEDSTATTEGQRYSYTPDLGIFHAMAGVHGDILIPEDRLKAAVVKAALGDTSLMSEIDKLLGKPWDDELETFRYAGDGAPVRWLHQVV